MNSVLAEISRKDERARILEILRARAEDARTKYLGATRTPDRECWANRLAAINDAIREVER